MFEELFKRKKLNPEKLSAFGAEWIDGHYEYSCDILDGGFMLQVRITQSGALDTSVTDKDSGEEYTLYKAEASGAFVGEVRMAVEQVLADISERCFETAVFKTEQARMLIEFVRKTYGDELEYLWTKFPDNAVWRRKDNRKWYGAVLTVPRNRFGFASSEIVEIIDLRIQSEQMKEILAHEHYYPGWHMNKKHWYSIILDDGVPNDELCERIRASYDLAHQ